MSIAVTIRHRRGDFTLDVDFAVAATGVTALYGPSGAGKTTTIDAVAGLLRPARGRIALGGRVVFDAAAGIDVPPRRRRVGYVFQDGRLFPHLSVRENLLFGWRRARPRPADAEVAALVEILGIGPLLARRPASLSGGERQRVALGRALAMRPDALLLDEPLAALDAARRAEILPRLEQVRDEARIPIVYVSHQLDEIARLADHVVVLRDGRVVASGSVFDVTARLDLAGLDPGFEVGAVLDGTIVRHDAADALTELAIPGGRLVIPAVARPVGARVRVRIAARDVMLALEAPAGVSANNVLAGVVDEIRAGAGPHADVLVRVGAWRLPARITRRSVRRLELAPGRPVHALVKTITVDRGATAP
jgi:molybdate transport system ATP-binding protein